MELLVTINGEVKSLEGALLLKKMWEIYRLMKWKYFFFQGFVNLMTLNLKKNNIIYFGTSKSEKIQECFIERSMEI